MSLRVRYPILRSIGSIWTAYVLAGQPPKVGEIAIVESRNTVTEVGWLQTGRLGAPVGYKTGCTGVDWSISGKAAD